MNQLRNTQPHIGNVHALPLAAAAFSNFRHSFIYISLGALLYLIIPKQKKKKEKVEINQVGHPLHIIIPPDPIAGITTQVKRKEKTQMGGGPKKIFLFQG